MFSGVKNIDDNFFIVSETLKVFSGLKNLRVLKTFSSDQIFSADVSLKWMYGGAADYDDIW